MKSYQQQPYPSNAYTSYSSRPYNGIGLHHTATSSATLPSPARGRSWNFIVARDPTGTIYQTIPLNRAWAAHHIGSTDRWRPDWVVRPPVSLTSDINYCSIGIEIVYDPTFPPVGPGQIPTPAQAASVASLIRDIYDSYGQLPVIGHGQVDSSRWPTEPHGFPWDEYFGPPVQGYGRYLRLNHDPSDPNDPNTGEIVNPISDEDFASYLSSLGTPVNPATAIFKRAKLSYERGETRGPAISDEYQSSDPNGHAQVRQRFTAGTAYYDPATGRCDWVEVNIDSN